MNITKEQVEKRIENILKTNRELKQEYPDRHFFKEMAYGQILELKCLRLISQEQFEDLTEML